MTVFYGESIMSAVRFLSTITLYATFFAASTAHTEPSRERLDSSPFLDAASEWTRKLRLSDLATQGPSEQWPLQQLRQVEPLWRTTTTALLCVTAHAAGDYYGNSNTYICPWTPEQNTTAPQGSNARIITDGK
ncbi:hypothetical protein [Herbaspirillum chlorophenolicum]|uniref:hypothetical protein n=1 Tax=Herbaspirillum chlorophenolicum TaxID=211589 RepID=UPI00067B8582|nr:hypothetical protein [Herbaspirillum chlorophenolicum]